MTKTSTPTMARGAGSPVPVPSPVRGGVRLVHVRSRAGRRYLGLAVGLGGDAAQLARVLRVLRAPGARR